MKILMRARYGLVSDPGGDTIQMNRLREFLIDEGIRVDIVTAEQADPRAYDLVHLFNITQVHETARFAQEAQDAGVRYVITPNYWSKSEFNRHSPAGMRPWLSAVLGSEGRVEQALAAGKLAGAVIARDPARSTLMRQLIKGYRAQQLAALANAAMILPNAESEIQRLVADFGLEDYECRVIYNGVDQLFFDADPGPFRQATGVEGDFALCVGRIEERKNQLALIRAVKGEGLKLVLIGAASTGHQGYLAKCRRAARGADVQFLDPMPHSELASAFAAARVHVLPSWYETPGLATLEAAAAGCRVASTDRGTAPEYLGRFAFYLDPGNPASIRKAALDAWDSEPYPELMQRIRQRFTWKRTAAELAEIYVGLIEGG